MKKHKRLLKFLLWFLFFITFAGEFVKIVFELSPVIGHKPLSMANAFFWSSLFLIEMVMAGLALSFIVKYPSRRLRLIILSLCHFTVILALPVLLDSWSWTCLLYPWPHSLQAFDPATPRTALFISAAIGFLFVPAMTWRWGAKAFCGYVCPHGAFYSETYGRAFSPVRRAAPWVGRVVPPLYLAAMSAALVAILLKPGLIGPVRAVQKIGYFFTAEFFFFVLGVPLLGGRSYCTLICPMGSFVKLLIRIKRNIRVAGKTPDPYKSRR